MRRLLLTLLVGLLIALLNLPIAAQNVADDTITPEIAFFRGSSGFNVPVLPGWDNQSEGDTALFVHEDAQARILATSGSADADAATIAADRLDLELPAPFYSNTVNLSDGTWQITLYEDGDRAISLMSKVAQNRSYLLAFVEEDPTAQTYMLVTRPTAEGDERLTAGLQQALSAVSDLSAVSEATVTPEEVRTEALPSGEWNVYNGDGASSPTVYGLEFGGAVYTTVTLGADEHVPLLVDAWNTTLLGGFFLTPSNTEYLILGIIVTHIILLALIVWIIFGWRNARRDLALAEQLRSSTA